MARITGSDPTLIKALTDAGLCDDDTRRVVIDIQAGELPRVFVEKFGDERLIDVIQTLAGVEITREEPTDG
jgi:hypothetical protein